MCKTKFSLWTRRREGVSLVERLDLHILKASAPPFMAVATPVAIVTASSTSLGLPIVL